MGWAVVTGASSGLGAEFARRIALAGSPVVLVARDKARLDAVAGEVRTQGVEAEVLVADLSRRADVERVARRVDDPGREVTLLVNNAGFGLRHSFLTASVDELDATLDVMVRAVMTLSQAAALAMAKRGQGAIINVSSIAALLARGPYSAHKAWVESFTEGLATDLRGSGVSATCVRPGLVRTEFQQRAGLDFSVLPNAVWLQPEPVVRAALRAASKGRVLVTPSVRYRGVSALVRLTPRWLRRRASGSGVGR